MGRPHGRRAELLPLSLRPGVAACGSALLLLTAAPAAAGDAFDRLFTALEAAAIPFDRQALADRCGREALCAARIVAGEQAGRVRLVRAPTPHTDTVRWASTRPSIRLYRDEVPARLEILRFGRKVMPELEAALARRPAGPPLLIDLRNNAGGSFTRMLGVAGRLIGRTPRALKLIESGTPTWVDLQAGSGRAPQLAIATVAIGAGTASAAEVLAALLAVHSGARLCGQGKSAGEATLKSVVAVDQAWRLLIERARVQVPPLDLARGLRPSEACP